MPPRKRHSQPGGCLPPDRMPGILDENLSLSTDGSTNVGQSVANSNTGINSEWIA